MLNLKGVCDGDLGDFSENCVEIISELAHTLNVPRSPKEAIN